jgi:Spy/CpxP family protein refolding chaperone
MVRFRFAVLAMAGLVLTVWTSRLLAEQGEPGKKHDHLEKLAAKLKLDDKQKDAIRKIHAAFDATADPVEHKLWALHHEEHEAMRKVLTPEQREKAHELFKSLHEQEFQKASAALNLTDDQKVKIGKIREAYGPKFHELAADREQGEKVHKQFRELRHKMVHAIRDVLTDSQREQMPVFLRAEHRFWRGLHSHRDILKGLGEKLSVTAEQKEQFRKLHEMHDSKVKELHAELRKLHHDEYAAIEMVLTDQQRAMWKELHKGRLGHW